jgi:hypothetical protein
MTEDEWLACDDPDRMLEFLRDRRKDRKLRLFACACCRRIWHLLTDARSREAVEVAERFADGRASPAELETAHRKGQQATRSLRKQAGQHEGNRGATRAATRSATRTTPVEAAEEAALAAEAEKAHETRDRWIPGGFQGIFGPMGDVFAAWSEERRQQLALLRDLFGNPFRVAVIDPLWLDWNDATIQRLARTIYDERLLPSGVFDPDRVDVLSDALEDAGCADAALLDHLRGPGPHVRGCWVVDALLGEA